MMEGGAERETGRAARRGSVHDLRTFFKRLGALGVLRLGVLVLVGGIIVFPVLKIIPLSFLTWSASSQSFTGPATLNAYNSFLSVHRGGIVLRSLGLAVASTTVTLLLAAPIVYTMRVYRDDKLLRVIELAMLVPFLFNPALRLHTLRSYVSETGHVSEVLEWLGVSSSVLDKLLFTDVAVCVGLVFSFSALLVLPLIQAVRIVPTAVLDAGRDSGLSSWRQVYQVIVPISARGLMVGVILMTTASWFSSVEYLILGKSLSMMGMLSSLLAVNKYGECLAFALVPFGLSAAALFVLLAFGRPEELFLSESGEQ